jgi:hypothetical protein
MTDVLPRDEKAIRKSCDVIEASLLQSVPYAKVSYSKLGGVDRASIFIELSLDPRVSWNCGIFRNSRYLILCYSCGKLECVSKHYDLPTFRKCKVKGDSNVVDKVVRWIAKLPA